MARVRARARGQAEAALARPSRPAWGHTPDHDLHRSLQQVVTLSSGLGVEYHLGWKTPIIGHLWRIVRRRIHQEIRIFVDALTRQQMAFNGATARVLARLVQRVEGAASRDELGELRDQVEALRLEVRDLREQLGRVRSDGG